MSAKDRKQRQAKIQRRVRQKVVKLKQRFKRKNARAKNKKNEDQLFTEMNDRRMNTFVLTFTEIQDYEEVFNTFSALSYTTAVQPSYIYTPDYLPNDEFYS